MSKRIAAVLSIALTMPTIALTALTGSPASAAPTVDQLERALLAPAQAPAGFSFHSRRVLARTVTPPPTADPCKPTTAAFTDAPGGSVSVSFQKGGKDGNLITESINAIGAKAAADHIKRQQTILDRCPTMTKNVTYSKWQAPAAAGATSIGFMTTVQEPKEPAVKAVTVAVAHGEVLATFTAEATDTAALNTLVTTGVAKIKQTVR
ncbi:hypothetical protein [Actinoplanes sp. G11-F43]|uniref:hypothetical protein n=1 Tax=Actinoplanes sp. G11-F43 TaxID=3424130 RepID=UPI003D358B43